MGKHPSAADIAEMTARGYNAWRISQAEEQAKRGVRAQEICELIREAFAGVKLGDGIGLRQAQGVDDYADEATCAAYRKGDEKEDWQHIPAEALNRCYSSLSFFDAAGMRFHLPAFLIADLQGDYHHGLEFSLTHLSDYNIQQFSLLSDAQRSAVRAYLLFLAGDRDSRFYRADSERALEQHGKERS